MHFIPFWTKIQLQANVHIFISFTQCHRHHKTRQQKTPQLDAEIENLSRMHYDASSSQTALNQAMLGTSTNNLGNLGAFERNLDLNTQSTCLFLVMLVVSKVVLL